jgi:hypothetical protein
VLRLQIHLSKRGVGEVDSLSLLASDLGCRVWEFPMTYLVLILGAKYRSKAIWDIWDPVVERFNRRLADWKKTYLSSRLEKDLSIYRGRESTYLSIGVGKGPIGVGLLSSKVHSLLIPTYT